MTKKEDAEKQKQAAALLGYLALGILIGLGIWWFFSSLEEETYNSSCVDDCVFEEWDCASSSIVYDNSRNGFIPDDEHESCSLDLESCVSDCAE